MGEGRHGRAGTYRLEDGTGKCLVLRAVILSGVLMAVGGLSLSSFLVQFSLVLDVQGAIPDQILYYPPIP